MRCRNCDYPLWNLRARECPECGAPFKPSDYEFVVNSARFCCPHCGQAYYGTGARGHLIPRSFACVGCRRPVDMDETVVLPAAGVEEVQTRIDRMPWFERSRRGLVKAWLATVGAAMVRPSRLIRAVHDEASVGSAWCFMFLTNVAFLATTGLGAGILWLVMVSAMGATAPPGLGSMLLIQSLLPLAVGGLACALVPVAWALMAHGLLAATGGAGAPLRRTAHAIFYSAGANALIAVPSLIFFAPCACFQIGGPVWWIVSASIMVQTAHRFRGARAALVVGSSGLVLGVAFVASVVAIFMATAGAFGPGGFGFTRFGARFQTQTMVGQIVAYAAVHGDRGPAHAALMVASGHAAAADFVGMEAATTLADVPLGETTLQDFQFLPPNRMQMAAQAAADALPQGVVAHRLGDFVFTYHGADLARPDPALWLLVWMADPDVNGPPASSDQVFIGLGDGRVSQTTCGSLGPLLQAQNDHRAALGLPPLPDPALVTHDQPAVAGQGP